MNINHINQILEKYWNAETDLNEEAMLAEYFKGDVAPHHEQYKPLFQLYSMTSDVKLSKSIANTAKETPVISMGRRFNWNVMGIAASLLLLITIGVYNFGNINQGAESGFVMEQIAITEEEEALEVTIEALAYLGIKWDNSSQIIKNNVSKMETVSIIK